MIARTLLLAVALMVPASAQQWTISHSYNGGKSFTKRGTLEWKGEEEGLVVTNEELTPDLAREMITSSAWYSVKIETTGPEEYVLATVPACHLRRANFKDEFSLTLPRVGTEELAITSLAYTPLVSSLAPKSCDEYAPEQLVPDGDLKWNSKASATLDTPGMTLRAVLPKIKPPPGLAWTAHPNSKKGSAGTAPPGEGGDAGGPSPEEPADSRPFFIKYWYVVLPLALANFMPAPQEPASGEGGDGATSEGGAAPAATAPAGGGGATKRRGKKG